jgi:peptide/nickel transport system permease protein
MADAASATVSPEIRTRARVWKAFRRNRTALVGLAVLMVLTLLATFAPLLTPYQPEQQSLSEALRGPSSKHLFGTDHLGRDILARILYGGRISLFIGLMAVALGLAVGVPLGLLSGYFGSWMDIGIQRLADILLAFPAILLALSLVAVLGVGLQNLIIAVGISVVPVFMRLARGSVLTIREESYVEAARALGASDWRILRRHVLPNALAPLIVQATLSIGITILIAAGLGFLSLGVQPPTPEWGAMLGEGRQYIFNSSYIATFPGLAIVASVLAFNRVGDGLRDALDPHLRTL